MNEENEWDQMVEIDVVEGLVEKWLAMKMCKQCKRQNQERQLDHLKQVWR